MNIGLLIIGSEVLQGLTQEANLKWLATRLAIYGVHIQRTLICEDSAQEIAQGLKALSELDFIITTGGLGPTEDDITKSALANFFHKKITFSQEVHDLILSHYQRISRKLDKDHPYNYLPQDFKPLYNPTGLAPGLYLAGKILALPGVPGEVRSMGLHHFPQIFKQHSQTHRLVFRTHSIPEEKIFNDLDPTLWGKLSVFGKVSSLPQTLNVDIVVNFENPDDEEKIKKVINDSPIHKYLWHIGEESLEEVLVHRLILNKKTIAFAESCTAGLCSHRLTQVSGSSKVFKGSIVSYANEIKEKFLDIEAKLLTEHGPVSEIVAHKMASAIQEKFDVDYALSITGLAGSESDDYGQPPGRAYIGISQKNHSSKVIQVDYFGNREKLKLRFSQKVLFELLFLLNHCQ